MTEGPRPSEAETVAPRADAETVHTPAPCVDLRRPDPEDPLGRTLAGRYRLDAVLGRGGMGVVYRAHDAALGRDVALKQVDPALVGEAELLARFLNEARITAGLQHPSIVPVYDLVEAAGLRFYTMRLVEGRTLADLSREPFAEPGTPGGWTIARALRAFAQVCQAVAYAHRAGVLHRDLKPANVMLGRWGDVHVLDWGLARRVGDAEPAPPGAPAAAARGCGGLTESGSILGTPAYMAPEQAQGRALDARADIYALGGLLYALLCGAPPVEGTMPEVLYKLAAGHVPPPPSERRPGLRASLDELCMRALAPRPEDRWPSAEAFADAVEGWLDGRAPTLAEADGEEARFLRAYRAEDHRRPSVAVDVVVLHPRGSAPPEVFLHRRARWPYRGCWAVPGSFARLEERLDAAALRVLHDEVGVTPAPGQPLRRLGVFDAIERDPRTRVISHAYLLVAPERPVASSPPDQADAWAWFALEGAGDCVRLESLDAPEPRPAPAFDHGRILAAALEAWRAGVAAGRP